MVERHGTTPNTPLRSYDSTSYVSDHPSDGLGKILINMCTYIPD
jgi:hypothetical protein